MIGSSAWGRVLDCGDPGPLFLRRLLFGLAAFWRGIPVGRQTVKLLLSGWLAEWVLPGNQAGGIDQSVSYCWPAAVRQLRCGELQYGLKALNDRPLLPVDMVHKSKIAK